MKINDIIQETTSAGGIATVAVPLGGMRKRPNPSVFAKKKKKTNEGEERSIIADAAVEHLVDVMNANTDIMDRESLEQTIYSELSSLDVEDIVDPDMEHGGQRMGDFASGKVIDVVDSGRIIDDVISRLGLDEGKSPHKKSTKKYKKHMAAMHAEATLQTGGYGKPKKSRHQQKI